ncbi:MAG: YdcF family protein [Ginsengibacter sp.]
MFFIISKILIYFVQPITWIIGLLIYSIFTKSLFRKKIFSLTTLALLIIFTNPILLDITARCWDIKETSINNLPKSDCAIVLGGFTNEDNHKRGYFNSSSDRFLEGLKLFASKKVNRILITSGNGHLLPTSFREADWIKTQMNTFGIADSVVIIENKSRNSIENAVFSKRILDSLHLHSPFVLITSAYHMRRSKYIFEKNGVSVIPFPCNYIAGRQAFSFKQLIPESSVMQGWNLYIKEFIGLLAYKLKN